jgi:hypothetical protein
MKNNYDINQEPIVISKITSDIFLNNDPKKGIVQEHPADLMALYWFYYYTAKWQKTDKAKATTSYAAKGLKWSEDRVRRTKKILIQLGLIEDITSRDKDTNKITGHYIYVKFIWWDKNKINDFDTEKPHSEKPDSVENPETNALNTINQNALTTNIKNNIYIDFLEKWNEQKIIIHKKITSKKESAIKKALKDFTQEEIFKSFQNYATVLHSSEYFWNYTWTMEDFLQRGLHRFVDEAEPLINLKNNSSFDSDDAFPDSELSPAGFPLITHSFDRTSKEKKSVDEWQLLLEGYTNKLLDSNIWKQNHTPNETKVFNGVVSMQKWLDNVDFGLYGGDALWHRIKPLDKLINYYIICINDWWEWMDGVKDNVFDVNNKIFKMFIRELEDSFATHINIESKNWINDSDWVPRD